MTTVVDGGCSPDFGMARNAGVGGALAGENTCVKPPRRLWLDFPAGFGYPSGYSVGEQPLDQGQVPMAYQDAACGRHIPGTIQPPHDSERESNDV